MDRIAVAGLSLTDADFEELECLCVCSEPRFVRDLADELAASELVVLSTCNRVEVWFAREEGQVPDEGDLATVQRTICEGAAPDGMHFLTGRAAARHLFRVVASLDSLVQGEDQILAQTREAFGHARDLGLVGAVLDPLFEHAFRVGKLVRTQTDLSHHSLSVMSLGVAQLARELAGVQTPRIALLGAGAAARHAAKALSGVHLPLSIVANRTPLRAEQLAADFGARALSLDAFRATLPAVDAVVAATSSCGTVLSRDQLERLAARGNGRFIGLDLAVPRDLPAVDGGDIRIIDLEDLRASAEENRGLRAVAAAEAERLVEQRLDAYARKHGETRAAGVIDACVTDGNELLERQLAELRSPKFEGLSDALRVSIERWARHTFGRLNHLPIAAYKRLVRELPDASVVTDLVEEGETTG